MRSLLLSIVAGLSLIAPVDAQTDTLEKSEKKGDVTVTMTVHPAKVQLDRKTLLTLRVSAPDHIQTIVPSLSDRLSGFVLSGEFSNPDTSVDGIRTREFNYRLTPKLAEEHRIAPMAISWVDTRNTESPGDWLATPPITIERASLVQEGADLSLGDVSDAIWLRPSMASIAVMILTVVIPLLIVFFIIRAIIRAVRRQKAKGLSPAQLALKELHDLIQKSLPESGQVREFYFELTMIVRRYIENAHRIRAPEQTTEEFLRSASDSQIFTQETLDSLRAFMSASDLVKYAAQEPDELAIEHALHTARSYIETDQRTSGPQGAPAAPPVIEENSPSVEAIAQASDIQLAEVFKDLLKDPTARGRLQMLLHSEIFRRQQFIDDTIGEWKYMGLPEGVFTALRSLADEPSAPTIEKILYEIDPSLKPFQEETTNV